MNIYESHRYDQRHHSFRPHRHRQHHRLFIGFQKYTVCLKHDDTHYDQECSESELNPKIYGANLSTAY